LVVLSEKHKKFTKILVCAYFLSSISSC